MSLVEEDSMFLPAKDFSKAMNSKKCNISFSPRIGYILYDLSVNYVTL